MTNEQPLDIFDVIRTRLDAKEAPTADELMKAFIEYGDRFGTDAVYELFLGFLDMIEAKKKA